MRIGFFILTSLLLVFVSSNVIADPTNLRQVDEGYWLSGELTLEDVEALDRRDIRLVVSLSILPSEVVAALDKKRIRRIKVRFGKNFPDASKFNAIWDHAPHETLVHCLYGADRTGVFVAYLMAIRHDIPMDQAILSMLMPTDRDRLAATEILEAHGFEVTDEEVEDWQARYSGAENGGIGGLKFVHQDYRDMLQSTLIAAEAAMIARQTVPAAQVGTVGHREVEGVRNVADTAHEKAHGGDTPVKSAAP